MTIREIASGGGIAFVVLTLVQIAPVKLKPWTWLARAIRRAINGDVLRKLDETRKTLDDHIKTDDARNADFHRSKILRFNNELLRDIPHTRKTSSRFCTKSTFTKNTATHTQNMKTTAPHTRLQTSSGCMTNGW